MISRLRNTTQANTLKLNNRTKYNLQNNSNSSQSDNKSTPSFKGGVVSTMFNFLNTKPAIAACLVDLFFMVAPRTIVDLGRSTNAGVETGIREASGTGNHATVGFDGMIAGALACAAFNKANGVKAHKMYMDSDIIDTLKDFVKNSETPEGYDVTKYWNSFFKKLKGLNTSIVGSDWRGLSEDTIQKASQIMIAENAKDYDVPDNLVDKIYEVILKDTGAAENFKIERNIEQNGRVVKLETRDTVKNFIQNANSMLKAVRDKALHDNTKVVENLESFLKGVKNRKLATVIGGMAVPVTIGISAQPINRYYTKKRTGEDGFVGVKGRKPDHSTGFKIKKTVVGLGIGSAMISAILDKPMKLYTNPIQSLNQILSKLQFKGWVPTMNQFKFIYGMTIMSRLMAARDKNELRESSIKDSLGFLNWLILGGFVSKYALSKMNKGLINSDKDFVGGGFRKFLKSTEKTHEEILYPTLRRLGIKVVDEQGNVKSFNKLLKLMKQKANSPEASKFTQVLVKSTSRHLMYKNLAQAIGYLYTGVVLGVGIPKLNIAITKYYNKNTNADGKLNEKMKIPEMHIQPESKTFSAFGAYLQ